MAVGVRAKKGEVVSFPNSGDDDDDDIFEYKVSFVGVLLGVCGGGGELEITKNTSSNDNRMTIKKTMLDNNESWKHNLIFEN